MLEYLKEIYSTQLSKNASKYILKCFFILPALQQEFSSSSEQTVRRHSIRSVPSGQDVLPELNMPPNETFLTLTPRSRSTAGKSPLDSDSDNSRGGLPSLVQVSFSIRDDDSKYGEEKGGADYAVRRTSLSAPQSLGSSLYATAAFKDEGGRDGEGEMDGDEWDGSDGVEGSPDRDANDASEWQPAWSARRGRLGSYVSESKEDTRDISSDSLYVTSNGFEHEQDEDAQRYASPNEFETDEVEGATTDADVMSMSLSRSGMTLQDHLARGEQGSSECKVDVESAVVDVEVELEETAKPDDVKVLLACLGPGVKYAYDCRSVVFFTPYHLMTVLDLINV